MQWAPDAHVVHRHADKTPIQKKKKKARTEKQREIYLDIKTRTTDIVTTETQKQTQEGKDSRRETEDVEVH